MATKPLDDRDGFIWMDGKMLPWREAKVHFVTHALHYATQVFEGERAYEGRIFKSRTHSERLHNSAKIIHLPMPWSIEEIETAKREVMEANKLSNAYVRVMAWRGSESLGVDFSNTKPHLGVAAWNWGSYFSEDMLEKGISLKTSRWRKPAPDTAPIHSKSSCLYNLNCMARYEAMQDGYTDALMHDFEGLVAECTGANFFAVKGGVIHTPIPDRFLNGITRQTVIGIIKDMGMPFEERRIKPEELGNFEEIFVTGSAAEVTAVGKIDDHLYKVGPVTRRLRDAYSDLTRKMS